MRISIIVTAMSMLAAPCASVAQSFQTTSPDGNVSITVSNADRLSYAISYKGNEIVGNSPLGFEFRNEKPMNGGFTIVNHPVTESKSENWEPVVKNRHAKVSQTWNEQTLELREKSGDCRRMDFTVRVFNDGVAFRYTLYGGNRPGNRKITRELTGFTLPVSSKAWMAKYKRNYTSSQESEFIPAPIGDMPTDTVCGLPFLVEVGDKGYVAISEAYIHDYPGFYIGRGNDTVDSGQMTVSTRLSPLPGEKEDGVKALFHEKTSTPWRVILVGDNPGKFIESEIITTLNPPCAIQDTSWIKPGMSAWDHWWSGEVKMEMDVIKQYIDFAAAQGWPYMLIDWQWYGKYNRPDADITTPAPQLDMPAIIEYAGSKGVKCWLWLYCSDVNRNDAYKTAFPLYKDWGIAGVKIDFMDRDDQEMVNWYRRIVKEAADNNLMVDFHGAYKPDGLERTYPNLLTREGVLGEEYSKFSNRIVPRHNVTLPFTRMLAGAMDYTPGGFLNVTPSEFKRQSPTLVMNSRCAELAKFVIYESPYTVFCDHPDNVLGKTGSEFLTSFPTTWDDTRFIAGYPGEYVVIARQAGDRWYLGAMTNEQSRKVDVDTSFLPSGRYTVTCWTDGKNASDHPERVAKKTLKISSGEKISINMAQGGGFAAILTPVE